MEKITKNNCLKVAIIGPESTGKSTLADYLTQHYCASLVPEFARGYLEGLDREYAYSDLLEIGKGQLGLERSIESIEPRLIICDTDLTVIKVWSEFKYNRCDPWIVEAMKDNTYDLYLLTDTDIPWQPDPLREHPEQRNQLLAIYKFELEKRDVPYVLISGDFETRASTATEAIDALPTIIDQ